MIRRAAVWLTHGYSYRICGGYVEIAGGIRLEIVGMDKRYTNYEYKEARLVQRGDRMYLHMAIKIPKPAPYQPEGVVAVDVNERYVYFGNSRQIGRVDSCGESRAATPAGRAPSAEVFLA